MDPLKKLKQHFSILQNEATLYLKKKITHKTKFRRKISYSNVKQKKNISERSNKSSAYPNKKIEKVIENLCVFEEAKKRLKFK